MKSPGGMKSPVKALALASLPDCNGIPTIQNACLFKTLWYLCNPFLLLLGGLFQRCLVMWLQGREIWRLSAGYSALGLCGERCQRELGTERLVTSYQGTAK